MRQKAGSGLPLHLPILYRKENSNSSGCLSFAAASALKGFVRANFRRIFDVFLARGGDFRRHWGPERGGRVEALLSAVSGRPVGIGVSLTLRESVVGVLWSESTPLSPETRASEPLRYY
jgi:hypothetical protein